jgi:hypothetical protein
MRERSYIGDSRQMGGRVRSGIIRKAGKCAVPEAKEIGRCLDIVIENNHRAVLANELQTVLGNRSAAATRLTAYGLSCINAA